MSEIFFCNKKDLSLQNIDHVNKLSVNNEDNKQEIQERRICINLSDNKSITKLSNNSMKLLNFVDSDISKSLISTVNLVYSKVEGSLTQSQRDTALTIKSAFENIVSGKPVSLRETFVLSISKEIFNAMSRMSEGEAKILNTSKDARTKLLIKHNKVIDKMLDAKIISQFSKDEIDYIEKNYKIKIVQENNELSFYYTDLQGNQKKVTKEDLKN